tara:strand:- start:64 stop:309 length:246 start_codon:yes stop_codon:yes gene_type:complete
MLNNIIYVLIASILIFVLYLAVKAITRGVEAKSEIKEENDKKIDNSFFNVTDEISKIQKLHENGVLTDEEFKKAKQKILDQ